MSESRPRVLIAEPKGFPPEAEAALAICADVRKEDLDRQGLLRRVPEADVLWVRLRHRVDREVISAGSRLIAVASPTTGTNHVDESALAERGIRLICLRGESAFLEDVRATAEHTIGLMLALLRRLPGAVSDVAAGNWNRDRFQGRELYGKTAGIIGIGRLGRRVASYLRAFDVTVIATDPRFGDDTEASGIPLYSLEELLQRSDLVSVHVPLTAATEGWFGEACFRWMKPGSWFINTSRGEVIDEAALLGALSTGHLSGAALDVLADERPEGMAHHPLVRYAATHDNLLITPHIGGATFESMKKTEVFLAARVCEFLLQRK
jgi:D-3-phosphoglycerate dehydrogenase